MVVIVVVVVVVVEVAAVIVVVGLLCSELYFEFSILFKPIVAVVNF